MHPTIWSSAACLAKTKTHSRSSNHRRCEARRNEVPTLAHFCIPIDPAIIHSMAHHLLKTITLAALISVATTTACTDLGEQLGLITPAPSATQPAPPTGVPTQVAEGTATPDVSEDSGDSSDSDAMVVTVWMPESLVQSAETPAGQELLDQIADFD